MAGRVGQEYIEVIIYIILRYQMNAEAAIREMIICYWAANNTDIYRPDS